MDFSVVVISAAAVFAFYFRPLTYDVDALHRCALTACLGAVIFVVGFQRTGGYAFRRLPSFRWQAGQTLFVWTGAVAALLLLAFILKVSATYSRGWASAWAMTTLFMLLFERGLIYFCARWWLRDGHFVRNVVIVGAGKPGEELVARLQQLRDPTVAIVGIFDDRKSRIDASVCGWEVLGTTDDLVTFSRETPIDEVIVALPLNAEQRLMSIFAKLKLLPVDLRLSAQAVAASLPVHGISHIGSIPVLEIVDRPLKHWSAVVKAVEDIVIASVLLAIFGLPMAIIALLIRCDSPGPVFFVQERFGFNNNIIRVLKFRTMYVNREDPSGGQRTIRNDPRVTRVGRFLRAWSIDELPQLINVLKGDMAIVGPRPHALTMKAGNRLYHEAVKDYLHRHRVKPGLTGWAQVNGLRGEIDSVERAKKRVAYDLRYIENWSLWLDLYIIAKTLKVVLSRSEAY